jgi:predicted RNA-binding protein YlqC (UPF0109 family)
MSAEHLNGQSGAAADGGAAGSGVSGGGVDDGDIMAAAMDENYGVPSEEDARLIELVGFLVQGIVSNPDDVEVEEFFDDIGVVYGIRVHPDDVGRVIGKEGRVANALRQVVKAAATKTGERVTVEVITDDAQLEIIDSDEVQDEPQQ